MQSRRVVVTGLGALTPLGNTVDEFWTNLISGKSGAALITRFDTTKFKTRFACELKDYNPLNYFEKSEVRKIDPFTQYALVSTAEALKLLSGSDVDVLVSDIGMPGEDGYSLLQQVRSLAPGRNGDIPAMALTAYVRGEDRVKAIRAGFHMHATKPVDPAELIAAVANLGRLRTRA